VQGLSLSDTYKTAKINFITSWAEDYNKNCVLYSGPMMWWN